MLKTEKKHPKTAMSGFGGTKRVNHDSASFYSRKMFDDIDIDQSEYENSIGKYRNGILCKDSTNLKSIPDSSVHLMVKSPPNTPLSLIHI